MRADVFDDYCKIMEEKGFLKKAETSQDQLTEESKIKSKEYADTIQALYGVKLKLNDSDENIVEQAHPGKMFVSPAYDKVNGLVEDVQEAQDIIIGIVNKMPNGALTGHRIAESNLLNELIRLGFDLENKGKHELSKQADVCAHVLNKQIEKTAFWPLLGTIVKSPLFWKGVGALTGYAAFKNMFGSNIQEGLAKDTDKAIQEVADLLPRVAGKDKTVVNSCLNNLKYLKNIIPQVLSLTEKTEDSSVESIDSVETAQEQMKLTSSEIEKLSKFISYFDRLSVKLKGYSNQIENFTDTESASSNEVYKSLKGIWQGIAGSDFSEARRALDTLTSTLDKEVKSFNDFSQRHQGSLIDGSEAKIDADTEVLEDIKAPVKSFVKEHKDFVSPIKSNDPGPDYMGALNQLGINLD